MKHLYSKLLLVVFMCLSPMVIDAQDIQLYKQIVKELSSSKYQGRGYARDGANKAGKYLEKEFQKAGVDEAICQPFKLDINTFSGKMKMWAVVLSRIITPFSTLGRMLSLTAMNPYSG